MRIDVLKWGVASCRTWFDVLHQCLSGSCRLITTSFGLVMARYTAVIAERGSMRVYIMRIGPASFYAILVVRGQYCQSVATKEMMVDRDDFGGRIDGVGQDV